ncbi:MAG: DUF5615 family PIN-like protein [Chloroflexi bacterium]|nr:DUF5615 family PIN-like protein [Chloroflexota bacterium]
MTPKLLLDENISPQVAVRLRQFGFDVVHVREVNLRGHEDSEIMDFASRAGLCLVTLDADFSDIRNYPLGSHKGIIRLKLRFASSTVVVNVLLSLLSKLASTPVEKGLLVVSDASRYRVKLPKGT